MCNLYIINEERNKQPIARHIIHENTIAVENESHCDFVKLREMLISTNMEDMREKTHCRHYELYRKKRLEQVCFIKHFNENRSFLIVACYEF